MNLYSLISTGSNQTMSIIAWEESSSLSIPGFTISPYNIPDLIPVSKSATFYSDYEFELLYSQSTSTSSYTPIDIGTSSIVSWSVYESEYFAPDATEIPSIDLFKLFNYPEFIKSENTSSIFGFDISVLNNIIQNSQSFIEVSNTKVSSSLYSTVKSLQQNTKRQFQIDVVTKTMQYQVPSWADEIIVMTIGGGGAGGGGVKANSYHQFAVGGAGGAGGNIAYSRYQDLLSVKNEIDPANPSGYISIIPSSYIVSCFIGPKAKGGIAYTGSGHIFDFQGASEHAKTMWFGSDSPFLSAYLNGRNSAYSRRRPENDISKFQKYAVWSYNPNSYPRLQNSESYAAILGHPYSRGEHGSDTLAVITRYANTDYDESNPNTARIDVIDSVKSSGGGGGWSGHAFAANPMISHSFQYLTMYRSGEPVAFPVSQPGANLNGSDRNYGQNILVGGPGGHGVSLPLIPTSSNPVNPFYYARDWELYANSAPSLPWGTRENVLTTSSSTDPYAFPKGLLLSPWGMAKPGKNIRFAYHIPRTPDYPENFIYLNRAWNWNARDDERNWGHVIPSDIAPTGGGGGTGWVKTVGTPTTVDINESYLSIGTGGRLNKTKDLFGYKVSTGGNGGNLSTLNSLSVTLPTSGSGPGAGGGGGASSDSNGTPQNGADGEIGAVVIISLGQNYNTATTEK